MNKACSKNRSNVSDYTVLKKELEAKHNKEIVPGEGPSSAEVMLIGQNPEKKKFSRENHSSAGPGNI